MHGLMMDMPLKRDTEPSVRGMSMGTITASTSTATYWSMW